MDSIYWVITRDCNQRRPHCYNNSEPGAPGLSREQVETCVANLPDPDDVSLNQVCLSGGEPLVHPELFFGTLRLLRDRHATLKLIVMTNGDLLDEAVLDRMLEHGICRIDIASMDKYHPKSTLQRRGYLEDLFRSRGMEEASEVNVGAAKDQTLLYAFFGATEDLWIGPLWPRGRAMLKGLSKATPQNRFCADYSGAKNFLNYRGEGCEVNIQLSDVYPCCPMTCRPIGSLLEEPLVTMLDRCAEHPVYRALNEGRPEAMGEYLGIAEAEGSRRSQELGNHCLWCDEFFTKHAPELLHHGAVTERGLVDLNLISRWESR